MDGARRVNYDYEHVGLPWFRVSSPLCRPPGLDDDQLSRVSSPIPVGLGTTATLTVRRLQGQYSMSYSTPSAVLYELRQEAFEKCRAHSLLRAVLHCHSPGVATAATVARRLRIDVHDDDDNDNS